MVQCRYQKTTTLWKKKKRYRYIYLMLLPVVAYYLIFHYSSMYYAVIAFLDY